MIGKLIVALVLAVIFLMTFGYVGFFTGNIIFTMLIWSIALVLYFIITIHLFSLAATPTPLVKKTIAVGRENKKNSPKWLGFLHFATSLFFLLGFSFAWFGIESLFFVTNYPYVNIKFWLLVFAISGLYNIKRRKRLIDELSRVFIAVSASMSGVIIFAFFIRQACS